MLGSSTLILCHIDHYSLLSLLICKLPFLQWETWPSPAAIHLLNHKYVEYLITFNSACPQVVLCSYVSGICWVLLLGKKKPTLFGFNTFECSCINIDLHCCYFSTYVKILKLKTCMYSQIRSKFLNVDFHYQQQSKLLKIFGGYLLRLNHFQC